MGWMNSFEWKWYFHCCFTLQHEWKSKQNCVYIVWNCLKRFLWHLATENSATEHSLCLNVRLHSSSSTLTDYDVMSLILFISSIAVTHLHKIIRFLQTKITKEFLCWTALQEKIEWHKNDARRNPGCKCCWNKQQEL